ncbi:MAG: phenylalanine--tRNA ligase subunit alpha, partial [Haloarculaceae archaeon]
MKLPDTQVAVLESASATDPETVEQLAADLDEKPETVTRAVFELRDAGLLSVAEETVTDLELTDEARTYVEEGLPELRLYRAALDADADEAPVPMGEAIGAAGLDGPAVDIALSNYARKGLGTIESGELTADPDADHEPDPEAAALDRIAGGEIDVDGAVVDRLVERGLVERHESTVRSVTLTDEAVDALMLGEVEVAETVDRVTPELLTSGEWRDVEFTEYNVEADAEAVTGGRVHILRQTANRVKDVLVGMGFQEMEGPHADAEFWINDCLFMPQDH